MSVGGQLACGRLSTAKDGCRSCAESGASNDEGCATLQVCATLLLKEPVAKRSMSPHSSPCHIHSTLVRWRLLLRFLFECAVDPLLLLVHPPTVSLRSLLLKLSFNMVRKDAVWAHVNRLGTSGRYKCNYCNKERWWSGARGGTGRSLWRCGDGPRFRAGGGQWDPRPSGMRGQGGQGGQRGQGGGLEQLRVPPAGQRPRRPWRKRAATRHRHGA